ncbi:MAG: hypothetical protein VKP62_13455 [Candidatus Sericytochromatia bacterium]|nr:hypothetical protein [Candidatus Sericytochromatia bacterium]
MASSPASPPRAYLRGQVHHAFDTGAHVSVLLRDQPELRFVGQVLEVVDDAFSVTHVADGVAWRWSFSFDDVSALGMRLALPSEPGLAPGCPRHESP